MNVYECTLVIADGIAETQAVGAAIELQVERIIGTQAATSGGVSDGNKGDITVSGSGAVWNINAGAVGTTELAGRSVTAAKLFEVGHEKLIGRHGAGAGDAQEVGIDGGLEFQGGNIRRAALTGDVTASAGDNATTIAAGAVTTAKMGGDVTTAGKALLDDADAAAQRTTLGLGTAATANTGDFAAASHTHTLFNITQSGATTGQIVQWNGTAWAPVTFTAGISGTLGTTDNALTRADGTGGATAQGSGVTLDDSTNLSATNWTVGVGTYSGRTFAKFCGVGSNVAIVLGPTGTGFICATTPDGTSTGGNNRGAGAVDLQMSRSSPTRVASGSNSFAAGTESTVSGANAAAIGTAHSVTSDSGMATGNGARCYNVGQWSHASAAPARQVQTSTHTLFRTTTDATPATIFIDGSSAVLTVPANSCGCAIVTIVATTGSAVDESKTWRRRVNWRRNASAASITIDVQTMEADRGYTGGAWGAGPAWTAAITADTTNGGFTISGTGEAGKTIAWGAWVDWLERINP